MAALLASISAIAFGVGDFLGGLSARRLTAITTAFVTQVNRYGGVMRHDSRPVVLQVIEEAHGAAERDGVLWTPCM